MAIGHGDKLSRKQEQAVAALLNCPSIARAAEAIGVSARSLRAWLKEPQFAAAFRQARQEVVEVAIGGVQQLTGAAVMTLQEALSDGNLNERLRAVSLVMNHALKGLETADMLARLEAMEQRLTELLEARNSHDDSPDPEADGEAGADVAGTDDAPDDAPEPEGAGPGA
jgi:hypothetical protein